jgi:hypothetical protein
VLDPVEHAIDVDIEATKFIIAGNKDAPREISTFDFMGCSPNVADTPLDLPSEVQSTGYR